MKNEMAAPEHHPKQSDVIPNTISVKLNDHVHFKPNPIQLLSNRASNEQPAVYSILSSQPRSTQNSFHSSTIFTTNLRQGNNIIPTALISGSNVQQQSNLSNTVSEVAPSLTFNTLNASLHINTTEHESVQDKTNSFNSTEQLSTGQHIFNSNINATNLNSTSVSEQLANINASINKKEKVLTLQTPHTLPYTNHAMTLASNIQIGLPTMSGSSVNSLNSQQHHQNKQTDTNEEQHVQDSSTSTIQYIHPVPSAKSNNQHTTNIQYIQPAQVSKANEQQSTSIQYIQPVPIPKSNEQHTTSIQYIHSTPLPTEPQNPSIQYIQPAPGPKSQGTTEIGLQNDSESSGMVSIETHQTTSNNSQQQQQQTQTQTQQPQQQQHATYVILQATGEGESVNPTQVFLAMQGGNISQESNAQSYITLQPVSVDSNDLSGGSATMVQQGVSVQPAVLHTNVATSGVDNDGKTLINESGQQVIFGLPGQQAILPATSNGQTSLVTYLQPLGNLAVPGSNIGQGQVLMAASDLQGNVTLHNVPAISGGNKRNMSSSRQTPQVGLTTPRRRLSQDPRSCVQCGRVFKYPSDLKKHLQIHTDIKKFACDDCPRTFRRLHQLNVHRRIHTGEKPYVCNRCGAQFRHDSTLTMHIRTRHDHLKPFTCDGCSKKFGRMSHLRKHQRNVCGRGNIRGAIAQCKYCEMTFSKKADLKGHFNLCEKKPDRAEKEALSPSEYNCGTCGKDFTRLYDLKRHMLSHSDEKPYGCPQCGKTFKERNSLNKHVKRMHCSDGDGTIPLDDDEIIVGDDDDDEEDEDDEDEILSGDEDSHHGHNGLLSFNTDYRNSIALAQISGSGLSVDELGQPGILSGRHEVMTAHGQTISATDILNFPEVAQALGINSNAHATVLDSDGHSTMIAITQPGGLETSEVSMDMDQSIIVTDSHDDCVADGYMTNETLMNHSVHVVSDSVHVVSDAADHLSVFTDDSNEAIIYRDTSGSAFQTQALDSGTVFKQEDEEHFLKREEELSDHVKAEQAAAHDLLPEDDTSNVDVIVTHIMNDV